jgi:hypothetical protein
VHGEHRNARLLRAARKLGGVDRTRIPPEPHLQRDGDLYGADHRIDQRQRMIEIAHQRRARRAVRHLLRRAAHVDVDDVGALPFGDARALRHPIRLAAGKLHDMDADAAAFAAHGGFALALHQTRAGGHLRHDQTRAQALGQPAERRVGDA